MLTSRVVVKRGADGNEDVHGPRVEVLVRIPLARAVEVGLVRGGSLEAPAAFLAAVEACVERVLAEMDGEDDA